MKKQVILLCISMLIAHTIFAQMLTVDPTNKQQQISMIGTDFERSANFMMKAKDPDQVAQWCVGDIPYTATRVSYDKQQELEEGVKNYEFYSNGIETMKLLRKHNPDIKFYATMKSDYNGYGTVSASKPEGRNNLPSWICDWGWHDDSGEGNYTEKMENRYFYVDKYVGFLADYLELMDSEGLTISYMTVSKEWYQVINAERTIEIIEALIIELNDRNIAIPKFTDPSAWSVDQSTTFVNEIIALGKTNLFHAFTTHHYNNSETKYPDFVEACNNAGKYAWNDEVGYGTGPYGSEEPPFSSLLGTYESRTFFYECGGEGEMFFEISSRGYNNENRAVYFTNGSEAKRMKSYYVAKLFAEHIYNYNYVEPKQSLMMSDITTMAFVNDDEIALWVINSFTDGYDELSVNLGDTEVNGEVIHYSFDEESNTQGNAEVIYPENNSYKINFKPESINLYVFKLNEVTPDVTDIISVDKDTINFGVLSADATAGFEQEFALTVTDPSTDVISETGSSAFSVSENASITKSGAVWFKPVTVSLDATDEGQYESILTVSSGDSTKTIVLIGEMYTPVVKAVPFIEDFAYLETNSGPAIEDATLNQYTSQKGWTIVGGTSTVRNSDEDKRIYIKNIDNTEAAIYTPEIEFDGPFEVQFNARMLLGDKSSGEGTAVNNATRNFCAVLGEDTIYHHHYAGSTLFQNYNTWTSTYAYTGTERIKFIGISGNTEVWEGTNDGLIFGTKDNFRVQATTKPTLNIAYAEVIDAGQFLTTDMVIVPIKVKGWNLTEGLSFIAENTDEVSVSPDTLSLTDNTIDSEIFALVKNTPTQIGDYTQVIKLSGEKTQIKDRTITIKYSIINESTDIEEVETTTFNAYGTQGNINVKVETPCTVAIFNLTGVKLLETEVSSSGSFTMPAGIYIAVVGNQSQKVVVN